MAASTVDFGDAIAEVYDARPTKAAEELVEWLRDLHRELAERLHNREDTLDMTPA